MKGIPATEKVDVAREPCQWGPCCTHLCCITCIHVHQTVSHRHSMTNSKTDQGLRFGLGESQNQNRLIVCFAGNTNGFDCKCKTAYMRTVHGSLYMKCCDIVIQDPVL